MRWPLSMGAAAVLIRGLTAQDAAEAGAATRARRGDGQA
jgi:hypothetical protein